MQLNELMCGSASERGTLRSCGETNRCGGMQEESGWQPVACKEFINSGAGAEQRNSYIRIMAFCRAGPFFCHFYLSAVRAGTGLLRVHSLQLSLRVCSCSAPDCHGLFCAR